MARRRLAARIAILSRSLIARHSPGVWRRSNGSRPPGPSTASIPAEDAGALAARKPRLPSSASNRWPPSTRMQGPRFTQSAAARGMPSVCATAAVSRSPAPAATTQSAGPITSTVPAPRSTTSASARAPGVVRAPARAAAGSVIRRRRGAPGSSPGRPAAGSRPRDATSNARPVLPYLAVAASAAAVRSTANRSSTSVFPEAVPSTRTRPTGPSAISGHAARSCMRSPSAVSTHGSSVGAPEATWGGRRPTTALEWSASARQTLAASPASC
jgi:hypothetical protein